MLSQMAVNASQKKVVEAETQAEGLSVLNEVIQRGVYILYGEIPWPYSPHRGRICGWRGLESGSTLFAFLRRAKAGAEEPPIKEREYRGLLMGSLDLSWQECPLCLKIGIGKIGEPFCQSCHDEVAVHIRNHLASYRVISEAGTQDTSNPVIQSIALAFGEHAPNPTSIKALDLTKGLINPEFFTSGHKSPKLQAAYSAARSARFEHGESP
jgi:hypothetical protein